MPSGDTHTAVNLALLLGGGALYASTGQALTEPVVAGTLGYVAGTFLLTPDLDLGHRARVRARRNWGGLGTLWLPLGLLVKHRGLTHTWLRGPLIILSYFLTVFGAVLALAAFGLHHALGALTLPLDLTDRSWPQLRLWPFALVGYVVSYWVHLWLDRYRPWRWHEW